MSFSVSISGGAAFEISGEGGAPGASRFE